ncbi:DUF3298 and DUF4163 domain-containing protein [Aequorivita marina]|uniref:DUF3298 and DUF4163 domain-containing protein n=1 Tax=Aequorivita marina TaxID=3073654 RepID=UPI0028765D64|nr:DUF3298 domain-containing protein [Aequorivita sp. S2608]MDS1297953.1 DUF3298 domain-containing protein [Aequorivita sp. S2608]
MKYLITGLLILTLLACKNEPKKDTVLPETKTTTEKIDTTIISDKDLQKMEQTFNLKRKELIEKQDQRAELKSLLISKSFFKEDEGYTMDFKYPYLNEEINPRFENFNEYISKYYLDTKGVEKQILEEKRLCDSLGIPQEHEKRIVEYKVFNLNDQLLSVLFYKENHYTGAAHASYTFETLNFDLERFVFMNFEDFFIDGSEEELRGILNELLTDKINSGDMYYDCWAISADDFFASKNNFVIDEDVVEYYFDDCVICPSYTGTYSIRIPLKMLMPVLRSQKKNRFFQ